MTEPWWSNFEQARPPSRVATDWVDTERGREVLREITRADVASPKRWSPAKRWGIGVFVAAAVTGGGSGAYALTNHMRKPVSTALVACQKTAALFADAAITATKGPTPQGAISACADHWSQLWPGTPKPPNFAVCVFPKIKHQNGGGLFVIPASPGVDNDTACRAIGADIIER